MLPVSSLEPNVGEDAVDKLDTFIHEATSANGTRTASAERLERQGRALTYSLSGGISTSEVFAIAEEGRKECNVEEYGNRSSILFHIYQPVLCLRMWVTDLLARPMHTGVTQSSLEQIFNSFASQQDEEVS